ncbi:MAG: hypothetical protein ACE5NW_16475 [Acidiferrobacterales bacterium]
MTRLAEALTMERKKYLLIAAYLLAATMLCAPVALGAPTRQVFDAPDENGKITRLDLKAHELVIGDTLFKLSRGVAVYTLAGVETTITSLKKGMRIAFNLTHDAIGSPSVAVIWIQSKQ